MPYGMAFLATSFFFGCGGSVNESIISQVQGDHSLEGLFRDYNVLISYGSDSRSICIYDQSGNFRHARGSTDEFFTGNSSNGGFSYFEMYSDSLTVVARIFSPELMADLNHFLANPDEFPPFPDLFLVPIDSIPENEIFASTLASSDSLGFVCGSIMPEP
ncbi:MAG: hypothetical protein US31_C0017G0002 [Berkelbacteria bacterium GW2011_GWA1_36_9]|uniref:Uncharacterized protein n=1 Tax=Berkelbacteria bacterium GW2011_GWA1_36_9 TaxID=1618331 RepID=A0A0G0FEX1_9BACT|nr:MAG: hypothetical protein US31_C0017G0002 [Berkelbacteria bacterium GW2011_GWA1_36_9]